MFWSTWIYFWKVVFIDLDDFGFIFNSVLFCIPPIHEIGHMIIAKCLGEIIIEDDFFWCSIGHEVKSFDFLHGIWNYSVFITLFCIIIYIYKKYFIRKDDICYQYILL